MGMNDRMSATVERGSSQAYCIITGRWPATAYVDIEQKNGARVHEDIEKLYERVDGKLDFSKPKDAKVDPVKELNQKENA